MAFLSQNFAESLPSNPVELHIQSTFQSEAPIKIKVYPWTTISELKRLIENFWGIPCSKQKLFTSKLELNKINKTLASYSLLSRVIVYVSIKYNAHHNSNSIKIIENFWDLAQGISEQISQIQKGLSLGVSPKLVDSGLSGTYFLCNSMNQKMAIFKPNTEEPFAPENPKGYTGPMFGPGIRKGVLSGEAAEREVAASLLDEDGFYLVPKTIYVELHSKEKTKKGSLQCYIPHNDVAGNYGHTLFPPKEVHKIGILDLRILNCDRNEENILVQKKKSYVKLIPVDHGLSFPDCIEICDFEIVWMGWPQSQIPFSNEELAHIDNINLEKDLEMVKCRLNIRKKCLRNFVAANILLKNAARQGFNLFEIGKMVYRVNEEEPSLLQRLLKKTKDSYKIKRSVGDNLSKNIETLEDSEEKLERLPTEDYFEEKGVKSLKKQNSVKINHKRRFSETKIDKNKTQNKPKEINFNDDFFKYFEGLLRQELEELRPKERPRCFSSELL